jgi:hypothetical protein
MRDFSIGFKAFNLVCYDEGFCFDRQNAILSNDKGDKFDIFICDKNKNVIKKMLAFRKYIGAYGISSKNPLLRFDDKISVLPKLSKDIYEINLNGIVEHYYLNYDGFIDEKSFKKYSSRRVNPKKVLKDLTESNKGLFLGHVNNEKFLHLFWNEGGEKKYVWYNKLNNVVLFYSEMKNDLNDLPIGDIYSIRNCEVYSVISDLSEVSKEVLDKFNLKVDSNPVIVKYILK